MPKARDAKQRLLIVHYKKKYNIFFGDTHNAYVDAISLKDRQRTPRPGAQNNLGK